MKIQIASFALVPDHIYIAEKNFHSERVILILSEENTIVDDKKNDGILTKIQEVENFYKKMNILVEKVLINYKDFMKMTLSLAKLMNGFSLKDEILLNLSGGRRAIPISLIYAGTFISNFKDINIKCVVIPEDKTYEPFNLIPKHIPDDTDIKLMGKIMKGLVLTDMEAYLGIKQPTISMRLKRLEKYGYIKVLGRSRELTELGNLIVEINIPEVELLK